MYSVFVSLGLLLPYTAAQNTTSAQNATSFALNYGYPLLSFQRVANQFLRYNATNTIVHSRTLDTPANTTVVKPNVDTLYSSALLDLSQGDLVLNVPFIPASEFALFSFFDPFGDNFANVGSGNVNGSGQYLVRGPQTENLQAGVHQDLSPGYVADVLSPTTYGILLIRWLVTSTNLDAVHGYQDMTSFSPGNKSQGTNAVPITSIDLSNVPTGNSTSSRAQSILQLLAKYAPLNPPETVASVPEVNSMLEAAGISDGVYKMPSGVDLEAAYRSAMASAAIANTSPANNIAINNGWSIVRPGAAGNFGNGTQYAFRAAHAAEGFLGLQSPTAVYPTWRNASDQGERNAHAGAASISLGPGEAIVYTFSRKPPLKTAGFWSLTAYAGDCLIPNHPHRYSIGDRSNLTYPDGARVYGSNASRSDGSFQILVQAADDPPPANWTGNWLPSQAGGGNVTAALRWYLAEEDLLDGRYEYPVVTRQTAITDGGKGSMSTTPSSMPTSTSSGSAVATYTGGASAGAGRYIRGRGLSVFLAYVALFCWGV